MRQVGAGLSQALSPSRSHLKHEATACLAQAWTPHLLESAAAVVPPDPSGPLYPSTPFFPHSHGSPVGTQEEPGPVLHTFATLGKGSREGLF